MNDNNKNNSSSALPYRLLDSGHLKKLEQVGPYRLVRPALNAFWGPSLDQREWDGADAVFNRDNSGGGKWDFKKRLPESWQVSYAGFTLKMKPTNFGHLGFFAEQYQNWDFFRDFIKNELGGSQASVLNLFAYSGIGSMAMAETGAKCCHLDAAKGMVDWGRENLEINRDKVPDSIRWIVDDVTKFCNREIKRGNKYNLIALDPPSFGRGANGQVWKIEEDLPKLLNLCSQILDKNKKFCVVLSCHSPGFSPIVLENMLREVFGKGEFISSEMTIPESTGRLLPAGISCRFIK
jgi:23S rRNA (cytosine1962-C5)-methyltransferase